MPGKSNIPLLLQDAQALGCGRQWRLCVDEDEQQFRAVRWPRPQHSQQAQPTGCCSPTLARPVTAAARQGDQHHPAICSAVKQARILLPRAKHSQPICCCYQTLLRQSAATNSRAPVLKENSCCMQ